jgi:hypothetical protein
MAEIEAVFRYQPFVNPNSSGLTRKEKRPGDHRNGRHKTGEQQAKQG